MKTGRKKNGLRGRKVSERRKQGKENWAARVGGRREVGIHGEEILPTSPCGADPCLLTLNFILR